MRGPRLPRHQDGPREWLHGKSVSYAPSVMLLRNQAGVRVRTGPVVHPDIPAEHAPFSTPISRTCTGVCEASILASRQSRYAWHDAFDVSGNISVAEALAAIFGKKWAPRVISQPHEGGGSGLLEFPIPLSIKFGLTLGGHFARVLCPLLPFRIWYVCFNFNVLLGQRSIFAQPLSKYHPRGTKLCSLGLKEKATRIRISHLTLSSLKIQNNQCLPKKTST
ncbi:hypothetical protein K0M31_003859 [Melipona bicolor]|uniref:Uncharacterized protein n=1 Tax=Melipona bicolor TaxID=60889 RepID=A0AA40FYH3_9HYME|nr:hypothetical protein K0M31_003859 [Melipona bicolor]